MSFTMIAGRRGIRNLVTMKLLTVTNLIWLAVYLLLLGGGTWGLIATRSWAIRTMDSAAAQKKWQQWSKEAERQSEGTGPVSRRKIEHASPPTLLILRDHFTTCLVTVLLLGSVLFVSFMFMLRGAFSSSYSPRVEAEEDRAKSE